MFYKLSNTANAREIEKEFGVKFNFPNLYKPVPVINGLEESSLPIITMDSPDKVCFAIWGLLPQALEENWEIYQNLTNTLNIDVEHLDEQNPLYYEALNTRRCVIIATGFFTSDMHEGKMYPHHVHLKDHAPFGIAGVYNQLEDGFITCSILVKKTNYSMENIPNILDYKPVVFNKKDKRHWLSKDFNYESLKDLVFYHSSHKFYSLPVFKEIYDNNILYKRIVSSKDFESTLKPI